MNRLDPDNCRLCGTRGKVYNSRLKPEGYRWRRHKCETCGGLWTSYETRELPVAFRQEKSTGSAVIRATV